MAVSRVAIQAATSQLSAGLILADANGLLASAEPRFKIVTATHDVSVTGDQAITGAGFAPKGAIVLAVIANTAAMSAGLLDSTPGTASLFANAGGTTGIFSNGTQLVVMSVNSGSSATAVIKTLDSDGMTITWAKVGTPTGTATMLILFLR